MGKGSLAYHKPRASLLLFTPLPPLPYPGGGSCPPNNNGFPLPAEKLLVTFLCMVEGLDSNETTVTWLRDGEPAPITIGSISDPPYDKFVIIRGFRVPLENWTRESNYSCVVQSETTDEDTGNPSASNQIPFGPRFPEDEANLTSSITCLLKGLYSSDTNITWLENSDPLPEGVFDIRNSSEEDPVFKYSILTLLRSVALRGNAFSCAIGQEGF
ncbi:UNVERIFIED_CONTAM: hypothetical protein K2H54_043550 [Gekko kuhli]